MCMIDLSLFRETRISGAQVALIHSNSAAPQLYYLDWPNCPSWRLYWFSLWVSSSLFDWFISLSYKGMFVWQDLGGLWLFPIGALIRCESAYIKKLWMPPNFCDISHLVNMKEKSILGELFTWIIASEDYLLMKRFKPCDLYRECLLRTGKKFLLGIKTYTRVATLTLECMYIRWKYNLDLVKYH